MSYRDREAALLARIHALETELGEARKGEGQHERLREENRSLKQTVAALSQELNRFKPRVPAERRSGRLWLVICDPDGRRREQELSGDKAFAIGTLESADVQLRDEGASRQHATVEAWMRAGVVIDWTIQSKHGNLVVNREKIRKQRLVHGDRIELADTVIIVGL